MQKQIQTDVIKTQSKKLPEDEPQQKVLFCPSRFSKFLKSTLMLENILVKFEDIVEDALIISLKEKMKCCAVDKGCFATFDGVESKVKLQKLTFSVFGRVTCLCYQSPLLYAGTSDGTLFCLGKQTICGYFHLNEICAMGFQNVLYTIDLDGVRCMWLKDLTCIKIDELEKGNWNCTNSYFVLAKDSVFVQKIDSLAKPIEIKTTLSTCAYVNKNLCLIGYLSGRMDLFNLDLMMFLVSWTLSDAVFSLSLFNSKFAFASKTHIYLCGFDESLDLNFERKQELSGQIHNDYFLSTNLYLICH